MFIIAIIMRGVFIYLLLLPIYLYRWFVSPLLGARCRYLPTCSEYAADAIRLHGGWAGGWLAAKRLLRCHPLERLGGGSGYDPVPLEIFDYYWYAPFWIKGKREDDNTDPS